MEDERQPMDAGKVIEKLGELEPGEFWLRLTSVERVLKLDRGRLASFAESIKPQPSGSTRRQTRLSPQQEELQKAGIFFRPGHVAVCKSGDTMPSWGGGAKYADIREPIRRGANDETTLAIPPPSPSTSGSSGVASPTSPTPTGEQRPKRSPPLATREGERSPDKECCDSVADVQLHDVPGADPDSDDESMADVREVGRPERTATPCPGVCPPIGQPPMETTGTTAWRYAFTPRRTVFL